MTVLVARWYYRRATKDLEAATDRLERLSATLLNVMEDNGWARLNQDEEGQPVGRVVQLAGQVGGEVRAVGELEVRRIPAEQAPPEPPTP